MVRQTVMVLEGMPGAGKTCLASAFAAQGWHVIPEYVVNEGMPPAPDDDAAHQHNWERKEQLLGATTSDSTIVDRNFLSSLAYAYSIRCSGQEAHLLTERVNWCRERLVSGKFEHPKIYCIFDCPIQLSLSRRGVVQPGGHSWTTWQALSELAHFYSTMPEALGKLDPALALGSNTMVVRLTGEDPLSLNLELAYKAFAEVLG